jgi:hypothetical protein
MNTFAFYRKVVAPNSNMHRNLEFVTHEVDFSFARDTMGALVAGVKFVASVPSANA